jgi:hypothetical protein
MEYNTFCDEGRFTYYPLEMESVEDDDALDEAYPDMEFED